MNFRRLACCLMLCSPLAPAWGRAQTAAPPEQKPALSAPTLSADARLVNLPVIVRDRRHVLVQDLSKSDFVLNVDGQPQTIRYFDRDSDIPLTLGLLIDTSGSQNPILGEQQTASTAFVDQVLAAPPNRPADQAFLIQFARTTELLQDLTSSRPQLQAALRELGTPIQDASAGDPQDSRGRLGRGGGTALYDAVFLSSEDLMASRHGRKVLVILSDGVDRGSRKSLTSAIESAQRADTVIYAIYFTGPEPRHRFDNRNNRNDPDDGRFPGGGYPGNGGGNYPGNSGGNYPGNGGGNYPGNNGGNYPGDNGNNYPVGDSGDGKSYGINGKKTLESISSETGGRLFEVGKKQSVAAIYAQIAEELRFRYRLGYTPDATAAANGYHKVELSVPAKKSLTIQTRDGYYARQVDPLLPSLSPEDTPSHLP